jgi:hypothetical protein
MVYCPTERQKNEDNYHQNRKSKQRFPPEIFREKPELSLELFLSREDNQDGNENLSCPDFHEKTIHDFQNEKQTAIFSGETQCSRMHKIGKNGRINRMKNQSFSKIGLVL